MRKRQRKVKILCTEGAEKKKGEKESAENRRLTGKETERKGRGKNQKNGTRMKFRVRRENDAEKNERKKMRKIEDN